MPQILMLLVIKNYKRKTGFFHKTQLHKSPINIFAQITIIHC